MKTLRLAVQSAAILAPTLHGFLRYDSICECERKPEWLMSTFALTYRTAADLEALVVLLTLLLVCAASLVLLATTVRFALRHRTAGWLKRTRELASEIRLAQLVGMALLILTIAFVLLCFFGSEPLGADEQEGTMSHSVLNAGVAFFASFVLSVGAVEFVRAALRRSRT